MKVDQTERFQLVAVDKFGNPVPGAALSGPSLACDPTLADITDETDDATIFDVTPRGKLGTLALTGTAVVKATDGSTQTLTATLNVPLEAGAAAALAINDLGPVTA